jgi:hypothetical protein
MSSLSVVVVEAGPVCVQGPVFQSPPARGLHGFPVSAVSGV